MSPVHHILERLDLTPVTAAIRTTPLWEASYDTVNALLVRAVEEHLVSDLKSDNMLIEVAFDNACKGILDLVLIKDGTAEVKDWKTTASLDRPGFNESHEASIQTDTYLFYGNRYLQETFGVPLSSLTYRALSEDSGGQVVTKQIKVTPSNETSIRAVRQLNAAQRIYESQLPIIGPWAMGMPWACGNGGSRCSFWSDCRSMTMPSTPPALTEVAALVPRSPSSIKEFLNCPEHYRRTHLCGDKGTLPEYVDIGTAFHAGAAAIWSQSWERRKEFAHLL